MNTDERKEEAKRHLLDYITSITEPDRKAGVHKYKCPLCGSGDHGKHKSDGAFTFYPGTNTWYCFACDRGGDLIALMVAHEGMSDKNAIDEAIKRYGGGSDAPSTSTPRKKTKAEQPKPQPKEARPELQKVIAQGVENFAGSRSADYMNARGFSAEILTAYQIGHDKTTGGVIIPYPEQDYYIIRYPDKEGQGKYKITVDAWCDLEAYEEGEEDGAG